MSANVNQKGNEEICSGSLPFSVDLGAVISMGSHIDINCLPRKLSCVIGPLVNCSRSAIDTLPDECVQEIFMRLAGRERSISACVSKCWLMLLASIRYSQIRYSNAEMDDVNLDTERSNEDLDMKCTGNLTRHVQGTKATDVKLASIAVSTSSRGGLGKLVIRGAKDVSDIGLLAIACCCPSLSRLSLSNVASVSDIGLVAIAKECRLLQRMDLCHCPSLTNNCLVEIAQSSPCLTSITIRSCANIGDESLQAIAKYRPNLQSISIKGCPLVSDKGVASVISECPMLTKVKLQALNITDFSVAIIGCYGKAITNLFLSGLQNVTPEGLWVMGNNAQGLENVSSLNISFCRITDLSLQAIVRGCPKLMHLTLRKCCFAWDAGFSAFEKAPSSSGSSGLEYRRVTKVGFFNAIFIANSKLKSLAIVKCTGIKDIVAEFPILYRCESLRYLSIRSCHGFGTTGLCMIGRLCPKLCHLDLSGLNQITATELSKLFTSCTRGQLTKVDLSHCSNLTDEVVFTFAEWHPLDVLNLNGCHLITDACLMVIAYKCPFLKELDISECSITDYGVHALAVGDLHDLKVLSISGCSRISDMSSPAIEHMGQTLKELNIRNCHSISSSTVASLTEKLGRYKILS